MTESIPELRLYNTMTGEKEAFRPIVPGKVGMYVSGITPCSSANVCHARVFVCFDVLYRFLRRLGYEVTYVRDFSDLDDVVINKARLARVPASSFSRTLSCDFIQDMEDLQCLKPTLQPLASNHIPRIIEMIQKIVDNRCGYMINGDIYFSVDSFPNYGCLSGRRLGDNQASRSRSGSVSSQKKNSADFVLWQRSQPWEPFWDSPWGRGRPGCRIGCSAVTAHFLGQHFDIHGGSRDLMFPHHENEIALSGAAFPECAVNFWMHSGFVNWDNKDNLYSMKKLFKIRDLKKNYHPLALRFFLMSTHYRSAITCADRHLETASNKVYYIYLTLVTAEEALIPYREGIHGDQIQADVRDLIIKFQSGFLASMMDDLQTSYVLDDLMYPLKAMNDCLKNLQGYKQQMSSIEGLAALEKVVKDTLSCLGLFTSLNSSSEILKQLKAKALKRIGLTERYVRKKIEENDSGQREVGLRQIR